MPVSPSQAPGELVDVGGSRLHALVEGEGEPAVLFEAGICEFGPTWAPVQEGVAGFARTIAYDRAGLGWSDPSPGPRTAAQMVEEARGLLAALGVRPPVVLCAHSFGALVAKLYAHRYPQEVAGLVLVDPSHEDQHLRFPESVRGARPALRQMELELLGSLREAVAADGAGAVPVPAALPERAADAYRAAVAARPAVIDGMIAESAALPAIQEEVRAEEIRTLGDLPLVVVSHGVPPVLPPPAGGGDEVLHEYEAAWQAMQAELAALSSAGTHVVAEGSGHMVHHERPDLVVDAVREVVDAARARARPAIR